MSTSRESRRYLTMLLLVFATSCWLCAIEAVAGDNERPAQARAASR